MASLGLCELGRTGLRVSKLAFGASPLGNVFGDVKEEDAIASVHEAARLGINFFDTSPYYGGTLAEQVLGKALKTLPLPRDSYIVSSKCGRYIDGFDFSATRVTQSVDESLARLNLSYIDIMQCHDIEFGSLDQIITETIPALLKLKESGKIRFIGITGLPLKIFKYVLERVPEGTIDVVLSYCHYSLNDTALEDLIPYLKSKGVGIISASPLSMGLLTGNGPPSWHPAPKELQAACAEAAAYCKKNGQNISKLAIQFALENHDIATTLVGMNSMEQVKENVRACIEIQNGQLMEMAILKDIKGILEPVKNLTWPSGREENN
ncbi:hypothetical protein GOP47_0006267 [Adiantum capillus-veneris]|uniref:NADP-dependent oxidoreductase domain-containing protein n=1 Tax=Adiantum capillus-veneris TaxID=13818 RepID=A0A9D4ZMC4_ADICA|nr:hypothetical protein GOP47_0006267 [Adiantum capillus-veneris]